MRTMIDHDTSWLKTAIKSHIASADSEEIKKRLLEAGVMMFASEEKHFDSYDLFLKEGGSEIALTFSFDVESISLTMEPNWPIEPTRYLLEPCCSLSDDHFDFGVAA